MSVVAFCCVILALFSDRGSANPVIRPQCRAGVCDDRPACPQSSCRCIYPSKVDCALYYQCIQGKPQQYQCSPGLLFNADTLTCDYDFNVNCTVGNTTTKAESSTGGLTTVTRATIFTTSEATSTVNDKDTTSDDPSRSNEPSTHLSSSDESKKFSTEKFHTTASNKDPPKETTPSESPDLFSETTNSASTAASSEGFSKYTGTGDTTTTDSFTNSTNTSDFSNYSTPENLLDTTYSKSSDFVTKIANTTSSAKQSEAPETTITTSATKETNLPEASISIFTTKESEKEATISPSTIKESEKEGIISPSTTKESKEETTMSTTNDSEDETTVSVSTKKESEKEITTSPSIKEIGEEATVSSSSTKMGGEEVTTSHSTTKGSEEETTISPSTINESKEETSPFHSTTKDREERKTVSPSTAKESEEETTISPSTTKVTKEEITTSHSTTKDSEEYTTTSHYTTKNSKEETTISPSTTKESKEETTISHSTTKDSEESKTVSPSTAKESEEETTNSPYTTKVTKEEITTSHSTTKDSEGYTTTSHYTTKDSEEEATISPSTIKESKEETTTSHSTTKDSEERKTVSPSTAKESEEETTISPSTTKVTEEEITTSHSTTKASDEYTTTSHYTTKDSEEETRISPSTIKESEEETTISPSTTKVSKEEITTSHSTTKDSEEPISFSTTKGSEEKRTFTPIITTPSKKSSTNDSTGITKHPLSTEEILPEVITDIQNHNWTCPSRFGLFPDEYDCTKFFHCSHFEPYHKTCPSNLHFNPNLQVCDWPEDAGCDIYTSTITTSSAGIVSSTILYTSTSNLNSNDTTTGNSTKEIITSRTFTTEDRVPESSSKFTEESSEDTSASLPDTALTNKDIFSTTYEKTILEIKSTAQSTVKDEDEVSTTIKKFSSTDSTQTDNSSETFTKEIIITEKFTNIPTTVVSASSNHESSSILTTERSTSTDYFSTESNDPNTTKIYSTIRPVTEVTASTEIHGNSNAFTDISSIGSASSITDTSTEITDDFTDASTRKLVTIILPSTEVPTSTNNSSVITDPTESSTNTTSIFTDDYGEKTSPDDSNISLSTTESNVNSSFVCPSRFGLFPDPENCNRFFHCSHRVTHYKWCPSGLHFNPKLQVCDWPYRAGCGGSPLVPTSEIIQPKENDTIFNETCNCECCFFPNKSDCSKYMLCLDGVLHRGQCAEGLLFNSLDNNCDIAERVTCPQTSTLCSDLIGVYPHQTLCTAFYRCFNGEPVLEKCPEQKHFKASEGKCVDPCDANCNKTISCNKPRPTSGSICIEDDGLYPAKDDCSSYYQCADGHPYFVKCPDGLHFNVEYGVCEPPCDARCDPNIDCSSPVQFANSRSLDILSRSCPRPNGLFPASVNCGAYYLCSNGIKHLLHCPPGLHYSIGNEACVEPCDAQCEKNINCTLFKSKTTKEKLLTSSYHLPLSLLCKTLINGLLSNPKDCTSFYKCSDGKAYLIPCPRGFHFDSEDKECKSPCLAGCDSSVQCPSEIPSPKGKCTCENCFLQDPTDCSAYLFCGQGLLTKGYCPRGTLFDRSSNNCRNSSTVVCEAIGDPAMCHKPSGIFSYPGNCSKYIRCEDSVAHIVDCADGLEFDSTVAACANPKGNCGRLSKDSFCKEATGRFADPKNSSLFYQCENGAKYTKSCSPPLIYNALNQDCDWPHNARDKSTNEAHKTLEITTISSNNKSADSKNSNGTHCQEVPGVICPCACRATTYDDCDSFYHCRGDGKACQRRCPRGLYFNKKTMVCDLPRNVECRDFFFATLRKLKSRKPIQLPLKYPLETVYL